MAPPAHGGGRKTKFRYNPPRIDPEKADQIKDSIRRRKLEKNMLEQILEATEEDQGGGEETESPEEKLRKLQAVLVEKMEEKRKLFKQLREVLAAEEKKKAEEEEEKRRKQAEETRIREQQMRAMQQQQIMAAAARHAMMGRGIVTQTMPGMAMQSNPTPSAPVGPWQPPPTAVSSSPFSHSHPQARRQEAIAQARQAIATPPMRTPPAQIPPRTTPQVPPRTTPQVPHHIPSRTVPAMRGQPVIQGGQTGPIRRMDSGGHMRRDDPFGRGELVVRAAPSNDYTMRKDDPFDHSDGQRNREDVYGRSGPFDSGVRRPGDPMMGPPAKRSRGDVSLWGTSERVGMRGGYGRGALRGRGAWPPGR